MIKSKRNRLMFALILVISHVALSAHGFEDHNSVELVQCELCVAQGSSDGALVSVDSCLQEALAYKVFISAQKAPAVAASHYPAWTQRAPPALN